MSHLTINIDGAARGNPGPAAFAYVIAQDGRTTLEEAGSLGSTTNNVAEYTALVRALERAGQLGAERLVIRSDSELLVKQMNGLYKVKNDQLRVLHEQAKELCTPFRSVSIAHVRRAENSHADRLCNEVLDGRRTSVAGPPSMKKPRPPAKLQDAVRDEAVACLRSVASAWARGDKDGPSPEQVWEQLWTILEENGVLRPSRSA
jgi:ribonuclease HI